MATRKPAMPVLKSLPHLALLCLCTAASTVHAQAADDAVTPYRPSVSSPAQLPVPGQLELELGGLQTRLDDDRRASLPYTFKLAFNEAWGVVAILTVAALLAVPFAKSRVAVDSLRSGSSGPAGPI